MKESGQGKNTKRNQCEAFTIDFAQSGGQKESLQDAFLKFKKDKQVLDQNFVIVLKEILKWVHCRAFLLEDVVILYNNIW